MSRMATLALGAIHLPSQLNSTVVSKQLTTVSIGKGGVGFGVMDVVPILNQPPPPPNSCFLLPSWKWLPKGCQHKNFNLCIRYREIKLGCVVFHLKACHCFVKSEQYLEVYVWRVWSNAHLVTSVRLSCRRQYTYFKPGHSTIIFIRTKHSIR